MVATAMELRPGANRQQQAFWVVLHTVTDRGMKLLHANPLRAEYVSLRVQADGGEALQAMLNVAAGSRPNGPLYETQAEFQHAGFDVANLLHPFKARRDTCPAPVKR
jgi:hypothetical protein